MIIKGQIFDQDSKPLNAVNVRDVATGAMAQTNENGHYTLTTNPPFGGKAELEVTHVAYNTSIVPYSEADLIFLYHKSYEIPEVEVNLTYKKKSNVWLWITGIAALTGISYLALRPKQPKKVTIK